MEEVTISKRYKRLISSLLFVLEQKTESIEHMLYHSPVNSSYEIRQDIDGEKKAELVKSCAQMRQVMHGIVDKLNLPKRAISQTQYINTIQSQMWENVTDAFSINLKGYGEDVLSDAKSTDPFIQQLSDQIDKLKIWSN